MKVNRLYTCLIIVLICLMAIGYATVESIILDITGSGNADLQDGIYITEVNYDKSVGADTENSEIIYAHQTLLNSNIILSETDQNSSITYEITIYNSNDTCYAFDEVKYIVGDETYSNEDFTFELNNLSHSYILCSKKTVTFTITFHYKDSTLGSSNILTSLINFKFEYISSSIDITYGTCSI